MGAPFLLDFSYKMAMSKNIDNRPNYLYRFSFYPKLIKKINERISVTKYHNKSIISGKLPKLMTVLFHFISQLKVNFIMSLLWDIIAIQKIDQLRKWIVMSSQSTLQCTEHLVATQVHQATEKHLNNLWKLKTFFVHF